MIYKAIESIFFIFEFWKKSRRLEYQFFRQKRNFQLKIHNSKTKMIFEKKLYGFLGAQNIASIDISINYVGWTFRPFGSLSRTPFFTLSVNN